MTTRIDPAPTRDVTKPRDGRSWWARVVTAAVLSVVAAHFAIVLALVVSLNTFDPAYALGISNMLLTAAVAVVVGLVAGFATGVAGGVRGQWLAKVALITAGTQLALSPISMIPFDLGWLITAFFWAAVVMVAVLATRWAYRKANR